MQISYDDKEVRKLLTRLQRRMGDMTPVMARIGRSLRTSTQMRFRSGTAPDGTQWKDSIRARLENGQTLRKTGRLSKDVNYKASKDRTEIGVSVIYGRIHQLGGIIKPKRGKYLRFKVGDRYVSATSVTMPARPFLGVSDDDWQDIRNIISKELTRK